MSQTIPEYAGCIWPADPVCFTDEWEALDPTVRERALALASSSLEGLTAGRVGGCPITVRPCSRRACSPAWAHSGGGPFYPNNFGGRWFNTCTCSGQCGCTTMCEVSLRAPVGRVIEVKVDGAVLPLDNFRLDNGHILVWTGGGDCPMPASQNLSLPDTQVGTFSITYLNAYEVDGMGAQAVALLAMEFAKACGLKGKCALPRGVTDVVRNGLTFSVQVGLFPNGQTNIDPVDAFVRKWNPNGLTSAPTVWSPGQPEQRTSRSVLGTAWPINTPIDLDGGGA